jgi:16S rRNA processing protein RimM
MTGTMTDIYLGRIVKAFGIKGELKLNPSPDFWEEVLESKHLRLGAIENGDVTTRDVVVTSARPHGNCYVLRIEGVADRTGAETLVGAELFISDGEIDVAMPDQALPHQLIGLEVRDEAGEVLGTLSSIIASAAHEVYEVTGKRGSFLVPAVPEFVVSIDLEAGVVVVRPIPGLIEDEA